MDRTATHAIKGFLYQFNWTLYEILKASDESTISIEGVIEDIEVTCGENVEAIQCKYHETKEQFQLSALYKPLVQMMCHFNEDRDRECTYKIYAHFPDPPENFSLSEGSLNQAISSKNKALKPYCEKLKDFNCVPFLEKISVVFGPSYDNLVDLVRQALVSNGFNRPEIDGLIYPNAIQAIADTSIQREEGNRKTTKRSFTQKLHATKSTIISHWTLSLKTRKQILESKRVQLKPNLSKNVRTRYFIINCSHLQNADSEVVSLICDFLEKYHSKHSHLETPLFCLDIDETAFEEIQMRIYKKGFIPNDGRIGKMFTTSHFFRKPITQRNSITKNIEREFSLRILRWQNSHDLLNHQTCDDLFVLGKSTYHGISEQDINLEILDTFSIPEIRFILHLSNTYD